MGSWYIYWGSGIHQIQSCTTLVVRDGSWCWLDSCSMKFPGIYFSYCFHKQMEHGYFSWADLLVLGQRPCPCTGSIRKGCCLLHNTLACMVCTFLDHCKVCQRPNVTLGFSYSLVLGASWTCKKEIRLFMQNVPDMTNSGILLVLSAAPVVNSSWIWSTSGRMESCTVEGTIVTVRSPVVLGVMRWGMLLTSVTHPH